MRLHFDGVLPPGYWSNETPEIIPKGYKPEWVSFTCELEDEEIILLREYLNTFQFPYWLHRLVFSYWCLCIPESFAVQFRLRFPCPSSITGAMKDFGEFKI